MLSMMIYLEDIRESLGAGSLQVVGNSLLFVHLFDAMLN